MAGNLTSGANNFPDRQFLPADITAFPAANVAHPECGFDGLGISPCKVMRSFFVLPAHVKITLGKEAG
jgi:hypothetical protein